MRTFVLRARAAPTNSRALLEGVGNEAHTEILAHTLMNTMFVAQSHRQDVVVHLVLESTKDLRFGSMNTDYHSLSRYFPPSWSAQSTHQISCTFSSPRSPHRLIGLYC